MFKGIDANFELNHLSLWPCGRDSFTDAVLVAFGYGKIIFYTVVKCASQHIGKWNIMFACKKIQVSRLKPKGNPTP